MYHLIFLKENIIKCIKDLSLKTTIFLVTHNNTLGMLMNPDCIIYTENNNNVFKVYTGKLTSEQLTSADGNKISSFDKKVYMPSPQTFQSQTVRK